MQKKIIFLKLILITMKNIAMNSSWMNLLENTELHNIVLIILKKVSFLDKIGK